MIGKSLIHYEITAEIGRGGMGEVYQAKDTKLGRDVAIKVLPEEFAMDHDRVARFQREAKLLASLNHPNIAAIYGLEESEGLHFLVMELIEGDTLKDRIKAGPIPVEEALKLGLQMSEALEAAHEKGVIHRDLKPANIKVTPDGKVKILDFGLAKAYVGDPENVSPGDSPTLSAAATRQGVILGTAAYMSPEQARGKVVDKRADIWAFGCVLYEMVTGRKAFPGDDVTDTLAAVLRSEPEWKSLPANLHWRLKEVLERCLEKKARDRYSGISDARVDIQKVLADPSGIFAQPVSTAEPRKKLRVGLPWALAALFLCAMITGVIIWYVKPTPAPEPRRIMRFDHQLPPDQQLSILTNIMGQGHTLAVSPDGTQFVYSTFEGLYLRSVNEIEARPILGTDDNPQSPFFSPDAQWIGYWSRDDGQLKKISVNGGVPVPLCDVEWVYGAVWYPDNTIVYSEVSSGIMRVSANGGPPEMLIERPSVTPQLLPDGKSVLFTDVGSEPYNIMIQSLESGDQKQLFAGVTAKYLPTGHLVYGLQNSNSLFAIPFDLTKLEITGGPVAVVEEVGMFFTISDSGTLVYLSGTTPIFDTEKRTLLWVDRNGKEDPIAAPADSYYFPDISPDGTRVALTIEGNNTDIWILDLVRESRLRLTFDEADDNIPIWSPDSEMIAFRSSRGGGSGIYLKKADGTGRVEQVASGSDLFFFPYAWSSYGNLLITGMARSANNFDIGMMSMEGDRSQKPLLQEEHNEIQPQISPDGRWMAYVSAESGQAEIFVRPFPEVDSGGRWQVSTNGGLSPLWSPDGRELFYILGNAFMSVEVETEPTFNPGKPQILFQGTYISGYAENFPWDIHPDGKRFLMLKPTAAIAHEAEAEGPPKINIVLNWDEELKERVPVE